jgi:hypothetical protein
MSLLDLASIGSFVSGASVLISLVFLYFQLRKVNEQVTLNTKHTQALVWQGASDRAVGQLLQMANADLSAAYLVGNGGEATQEAIRQRQFELQIFAWFEISFAEMFQQWEDGLVRDERWNRIRADLCLYLRAERGTRRFLSERARVLANAGYSDRYYDFLKQLISEAEATST